MYSVVGRYQNLQRAIHDSNADIVKSCQWEGRTLKTKLRLGAGLEPPGLLGFFSEAHDLENEDVTTANLYLISFYYGSSANLESHVVKTLLGVTSLFVPSALFLSDIIFAICGHSRAEYRGGRLWLIHFNFPMVLSKRNKRIQRQYSGAREMIERSTVLRFNYEGRAEKLIKKIQ